METRTFLAMMAGGLVLLALGAGVTQNRDATQSGLAPLGLVLKGAGLALLTYALYRLMKATT